MLGPKDLGTGLGFKYVFPKLYLLEGHVRHVGREVKALDLKSNGLTPA